MSRFQMHYGKSVPSGPLGAPTLAAGPRRPSAAVPTRTRHSSKKGYTGSRAGLGRAPASVPHATVFRSGPKGPSRFGGSVQLPARSKPPTNYDRHGNPTVRFRSHAPAPRPSLMTRIGRKMTRIGRKLRRGAAAFGL